MDDFQDGQLDVIICTYGVGSTGLTLTRSHRIILLDRPWTPGDARQVSVKECNDDNEAIV